MGVPLGQVAPPSSFGPLRLGPYSPRPWLAKLVMQHPGFPSDANRDRDGIMPGGDPEAALQRIEAALARLEGAAARKQASAGDWEARHQRLREAVHQSLQQLDDLIAGQAEAAE
jgi:hypothetical protein